MMRCGRIHASAVFSTRPLGSTNQYSLANGLAGEAPLDPCRPIVSPAVGGRRYAADAVAVSPRWPHSVQRAARRSMSCQQFGPQRMM
jgi:hypothetical protein